MRSKRGFSGLMILAFMLKAISPAMAQEVPAGNAEAGQALFNRQCMICHSVQAGQNKIGPSLAGILGRHSAEAPKFNYSPALKEANKNWDAASLDSYLADPRGYIPGARMIYAGLKDAAQRADLIAYLGTLK
jgi:cytochrome c